jgi:hypothetical protein
MVGKNNKLRRIFEHYGEQNQLSKLKEELNELIDEINDIEKGIKEIGNIDFLGELADVLVMCEQFRLRYNKVNSIVDYKINRQLGRIKDEPYTP